MDKVINAIKAQGIPASDIKTSRVSLQPKYEYQYPTTSSSSPDKAVPPTSLSTRIVGYTATNTVTVTVRDMSKVGGVIDAGCNGGANQIQGVTFTLSDEKAATVYKQALQKAVTQATDKAKVIASASGVGEIKLKSISESGQYYPVAYDGMERSAMATSSRPDTHLARRAAGVRNRVDDLCVHPAVSLRVSSFFVFFLIDIPNVPRRGCITKTDHSNLHHAA